MKEKIEKIGYKRLFIFIIVSWFLINLIQAMLMDVISDEAYYALFGHYIDWGLL